MKKLFLAVLALGALASCQKEEGAVVEQSNKKAVSITITNGVSNTRVEQAVPEVDAVADGETATIQKQVKDGRACADTNELVILFANRAGNVVEARTFGTADETTEDTNLPGNNYTYTFHSVHESVEQVAIVRCVAKGTTNMDDYKNTNLSTYANAAAEERNNVAISQLDLYASSTITREGNATCTTSEGTFPLYQASLTVKPAVARVEIATIKCANLGERTLATVGTASSAGGYDVLQLNKVSFGENGEYKYTFNENDVLKGVYAGSQNTTPRDLTYYIAGEDMGEDMAIAWNVAPSVPFFSPDAPMTFEMTASAYDYYVLVPEKTLRVVGANNATEFERGHVYRFNLVFNEENIDSTNDHICVDIEVAIMDWVVVMVDPVFGNGGGNTETH